MGVGSLLMWRGGEVRARGGELVWSGGDVQAEGRAGVVRWWCDGEVQAGGGDVVVRWGGGVVMRCGPEGTSW